jgi:hypothetical protein
MRRLPVSLVCLCLIALPATARAFQVQLRGQPAPVTLRGTVYDSLLRAPVAGARVWIVGGSQSTIADSSGHFRLDSVLPGRHVVAFEHPDLDSAGLSSNSRVIQVAAGSPASIILATSSMRRIYRALCTADTAGPAADSGVVFGAVQDVATGVLLSGVRVTVSWIAARTSSNGIDVVRDAVTISSDSVGNYYACGVPNEYVLTVVGKAGPFEAATEVLLGPRSVRRRDIGLSLDTLSLPDPPAGGPRRGRATVIGTVVDERGGPLGNATLSADDAAGEVTTSESGAFVMNDLPPGSQMILARLIGHAAVRVPVMLRDLDTLRLRLTLAEVTVMDTIRVTSHVSRPTAFALEELENRIRNGIGMVLTGDQLKHLPLMRSVFQMLPGLTVVGRGAFDFSVISFRGAPDIYVDGMRMPAEQLQSYRPDQLIAVEYFRHGEAPLQFNSFGDAPVVLIWTRFMR